MAQLTITTPGEDVDVGGTVTVVGTTSGGEVITITRGAISLDASFNAGGDTIVLPGNSEDYTVRLSGSRAIITSGEASVSIPIGTAGTLIQFSDTALSLAIDTATGSPKLGEQVITSTDQPVEGGGGNGNEPPVAENETVALNEGETVQGELDASDIDGDDADLTYEINAGVAGLILDEDGAYSFDASDDAYASLDEGETQVVTTTYTVTDADGDSDVGTITLIITGVGDGASQNEHPVAADEAADLEEGATVTGQLDAVDPDGDEDDLVFELADEVAGLTLNEDGTYTFDASDDAYEYLDEGQTEVITAIYTVTDLDGAVDVATITISITGINEPL